MSAKWGTKIPGITNFMHENLFVFDVSEIDYLDQFYNEQYIFCINRVHANFRAFSQ